jgi:WD40 repeat protein
MANGITKFHPRRNVNDQIIYARILSIYSAVYSHDGKKILSASSDRTVKEWDVDTGKCIKTLKGHTKEVSSAVYSPDGKKILSASWDDTIKEWDIETGKCIKTLTGHEHWVFSAVYSPDGKRILSASYDKTIKEWDVGTGQCQKTYANYSFLYKFEENPIVPGERLKISGYDNEEIEIIDSETGSVTRSLINIPGMFIQGCSFLNLHPDCDLSEESKKRMKMYGAKM